MDSDPCSWLEKMPNFLPMLYRYIPYGSLESVIPYLGRRAIENKSVLGAAEGGAADERRRAGKELWRRVMGGK